MENLKIFKDEEDLMLIRHNLRLTAHSLTQAAQWVEPGDVTAEVWPLPAAEQGKLGGLRETAAAFSSTEMAGRPQNRLLPSSSSPL